MWTPPISVARAQAWAFAAALAATAACSDPGGVTVVTVYTRPSVRPIARLEVAVANGDSAQTQRFSTSGRAFPLSFSVESRDRTGDLAIGVTGHDDDDRAVAAGTVTVAIDPDARVDVDLLLDPNDFSVNTSYAGHQRLAFRPEAAGRQLAVGPDGVTTIGWSDSCEIVNRCDVFGRRFDALGNSMNTAIAAGDAQFNINQTGDLVGYEPALATNLNGVTLAVWADEVALYAVAIDATGRALTDTETLVADTSPPSTPAVAALPDGRFVVTWTEDGAAPDTFAVKARYLEASGLVGPNPIRTGGEAYPVSTTALDALAPPVVVARADGNAHAVVWRVGSDVRGRFYDAAGQPSTDDLVLASYPLTDVVGEPLAARVDGDVVLSFARKTTPGGDADTGQLVLRRVGPTGQPVGVDAVVARDVDPLPAVVTSRPDGAIAVAWEACGTAGDGAGCGIRLQLFRPTLAPVGTSYLVNTTRSNDQLEPSLAPLPDGSFIAAWSDASGLAPDLEGFGIRARIVYPIYDDAQGVLGARCTASAECGAANVCLAGTDPMPRCYRTCDAGACPHGGTCTTVGTEAGCLY